MRRVVLAALVTLLIASAATPSTAQTDNPKDPAMGGLTIAWR